MSDLETKTEEREVVTISEDGDSCTFDYNARRSALGSLKHTESWEPYTPRHGGVKEAMKKLQRLGIVRHKDGVDVRGKEISGFYPQDKNRVRELFDELTEKVITYHVTANSTSFGEKFDDESNAEQRVEEVNERNPDVEFDIREKSKRV